MLETFMEPETVPWEKYKEVKDILDRVELFCRDQDNYTKNMCMMAFRFQVAKDLRAILGGEEPEDTFSSVSNLWVR